MDAPENPRVARFRFLTEAEFSALTAEEKMAYLKAALKEREPLATGPGIAKPAGPERSGG